MAENEKTGGPLNEKQEREGGGEFEQEIEKDFEQTFKNDFEQDYEADLEGGLDQDLDLAEQPPEPEPAEPEKPKRLLSLDALRGFDMFWIIGGYSMVESLTKIYDTPFMKAVDEQIEHVKWEGFVAWDLIMPLFLFITGVAVPFSISKRLSLGQGKFRIYAHMLLRVVILWILGMLVQGNLLSYDWSKVSYFSNTLQAIAAGYLVTTIAVLHFGPRVQVGLTVALLAVFYGLMMFYPVPEVGAGVLTETGNMAMYIDRLVLGAHQDGTTYTWVLSSITFAATVLMGALAGRWLRTDRSGLKKTGWLALAGVVCTGLGYLWGLHFPVIKHIWTSSMVLVAGGYSLLLLALFYLVIDVWKLKFWAFGFRVIGLNAIFAYVISHVFWGAFGEAGRELFGGLGKWTGDWQPLILAAGSFLILWGILLFLYLKKTFVKV